MKSVIYSLADRQIGSLAVQIYYGLKNFSFATFYAEKSNLFDNISRDWPAPSSPTPARSISMFNKYRNKT